MTFDWPVMLLGLVAVPLVVVWYRRLLRARAGRRAELAALGLVAREESARRRLGITAPAAYEAIPPELRNPLAA